MAARKTNQAGVDLIKGFEGCCLRAYRLAGEQFYTIGYGHYGADVLAGQTLTEAEAEELLRTDLARFERYVDSAVYVPCCQQLTLNQFSALVSFAYNCGPGSLQQLCKGRTPAQIAEHITAYTNSSSEAYRAGLLRRRQAELALYNTQEVEDLTAAETQALIDAAVKKARAEWEAELAAHVRQAAHLSAPQVQALVDGRILAREEADRQLTPASWSAEAREWAEAVGLIRGTGSGGMAYESPVTREQMVVFFHRFAAMLDLLTSDDGK